MSLRFDRFELRAFGPFTGTELELSGPPGGGLHIICGPNEVGKSTAQRGIGDFFFGIPARSTDDQIHDYGGMRLAAVLVDEHGRRHELIRRKGVRRTLLGPKGEPVDEGPLDGMLNGMTREVFEAMFSITHESLVSGGKALLAADGDLGESLFSASLGATGLHALRVELDQEASALFRPRATASLVLQARSALEGAHAELRETTLRATTFTELERQLKSAREDREGLVEQIREARTVQNARERLRSVIPLLAAREQVREELESLAEAPELPEDARDRRLLTVQRAAADRQTAEDAQKRVQDLERRIRERSLNTALLERELAIKEISGRLATVREGADDRERQIIKLETAKGLAQRALDQVSPDLDLDAAGQLHMTNTQRAKLEDALEQHARLTALLEAAEQAGGGAEDRAGELATELDTRDALQDTSALKAAVTDAQADGQIEKRVAEAEEELADAIDILNDGLRQLHPVADIDGLLEMRPPNPVAVTQFADDREKLVVRAREIADHRERLDQNRRDLDENLSRLALSTNVPTVEDLGTARTERDEEWQRLRRRVEGTDETPAPLDPFEGRLRHADDLADRLRTEADSVARRAQLTVRERRLETEYQDVAEGERKIAADRAEQERRWEAAWASTGIAPGSPREMTDWLRVRHTVLERADTVARRTRSLKVEQRARDGHLQALSMQLTALGHETATVCTVSGMLAMAQTQVTDAQTVRDEYDQLTRDLRTARATVDKQREEADEHRDALKQWQQSWAGLLAANGWPADVGTDSARQVLAAVAEVTQHLHEVEQLTARVDGIQGRLGAFARDATQLMGQVTPELETWPTQDAVAELGRRLDQAVQTRTSRETLQSELDSARDELETAERSVEQAERDLKTLIKLAGVATVDELPEVERQSARAAELREQLPVLEHQITEAGQAPVRELIERTEGINIDALGAKSTETEDETADLEEELRQSDVRLGELGGEQQKMERLDGAATAAENVEQRVAELRELTEHYLRLYLAAWALSEAIDAYRREHKAPLLKRADELFPQLTCGRFQGLEVSFDDDDEPVLVGVRSTGEKVSVKVMSTGTHEQLYLALRLASLERHVELHGPMPVILDDVVLHSDPRRKSAVLSALADLGRHTQVIAFTHDPQVVALAQNAIDPDLLTVHELGGSEITGALQPPIATGDVHPIRPAKAA